MNLHQPYSPSLPQTAQTPAESACFYPRRYARYAEMFTSDTRRFPCGDADGPMRPAPFRHTPSRPWPQSATPVWRNLDQHPRFAGTYTFSAKEKDSETGLSYFGSRYYSSDLSIWLSVDPKSDNYPSLSPYVYCANNPVKLVDPDGNFPIIPFLIKAGINAMADCLMQAAMNYYFNPQTTGDLRASFLNINDWITLKSGAEGAIPWKIPGGKAGRAAVTAAGDVLAYFCASPKQYTTKQALEDFTVGFIGELAGGGLSDLIAKYGAPAVAKGLCRIPGFSVNKIRGLIGYNLVSDYAQI